MDEDKSSENWLLFPESNLFYKMHRSLVLQVIFAHEYAIL
jgi:hypothetical protein